MIRQTSPRGLMVRVSIMTLVSATSGGCRSLIVFGKSNDDQVVRWSREA